MKAIVSGMVWLPRLELTPEQIKFFRHRLTVMPKNFGGFGDEDVDPTPIRLYQETPITFGLPRAWWFKNARGEYEYEWKVSEGSPIDLESRIKHEGPYIEQAEAVEFFEQRFGEAMTGFPSDQDRGLQLGGILRGKTGFGKTQTALEIIKRLGRTALVIVHKELLMKQWVRRIEKFLPNARVGIVREDRCEIEDVDIVIAMAQSLALDDGRGGRYPRELYSWPNMLIIDENHRLGAKTWAPLPRRFTSAFRLGLTATPRRKDGADRVFWDHIGEVVFTAKTEMPRPHIRMFDVRVPMPPYATDPDTMQPVVINALSRSSQRSAVVFAEIAAALRAPVGRKIFVLSHRLAHLEALAKLLEKSDIDATYDFYVGEWFTGEVDPPLAAGEWPMDEKGRKKAIQTIYTSISRRKSTPNQRFGGRIEKRELFAVEDGPFVERDGDGWGDLVFERRHLILNGRKHPKTEGIHVLEVSGDVVNGLKGDFLHMEAAAIDLVLEDLTDDELFRLARDFEIKQKAKAKKRQRTDEELYKAEEARVMFVTYQMAGEGIDVPPVDTIVLATPSSDVEQAIGRGRRFCVPKRHGGLMEPEDCAHFCPWRVETCEGKGRLVVSDVCDPEVPLAAKRESWRMSYYRNERFRVAGRS